MKWVVISPFTKSSLLLFNVTGESKLQFVGRKFNDCSNRKLEPDA